MIMAPSHTPYKSGHTSYLLHSINMVCTAKRLCVDENCDKCYTKSFASSDKAQFWSAYNTISPRNISKGSKKRFWFDCDQCGHSFETQLGSITGMGSWCPYCAIPSKVVCGDDGCDVCHKRSFASCERAEFWSNQNELKPRNVLLNSNKKYWFTCNKCSHEFEGKLDDVKKGQWCPFCAGKRMCDENCDICTTRSFASHPRSEFWASWNDVLPRDVLLNSHEKYWFICYECDHYFDMSLDRISRGDWCPFCSHTTLCSVDDCSWCHTHSFSSSDRKASWSPTNVVAARDVAKSSNKKFWFICSECNHEFDSQWII